MSLKLDRATLDFAIMEAWRFEFCCSIKSTKAKRIKAEAYKDVQDLLKRYRDRLDENGIVINN